MAEPFLSEIRIFGFNFAPRGWAQCDGQILPINQNQSLFSLLGTSFGGDGRTSFALPELRGRSATHFGSGDSLANRSGVENVGLTTAQIPSHTHVAQGSTDTANAPVPTGRVLADSAPNEVYHTPTSLVPVHAATIGSAGSGSGHQNMQPYLTVTFCIALTGLFPSRN